MEFRQSPMRAAVYGLKITAWRSRENHRSVFIRGGSVAWDPRGTELSEIEPEYLRALIAAVQEEILPELNLDRMLETWDLEFVRETP
jgi:hypothetical protein